METVDIQAVESKLSDVTVTAIPIKQSPQQPGQSKYAQLLGVIEEMGKEKTIKVIREDLIELWEKCHFAPCEREKFEYLHDNHYTGDLLLYHESEIEKMKKYYNKNKEVLLKIEMKDQYWKRKEELEERAMDPNC